MSPSLPHWLTNIIRQEGVYPHDSATSTHSVTSFDLQHFHLEMYKSNLGLTIKRINSTLTQQKTRCEVHNFYGFYEDQFIFDSILMWTEKMFDVDYSQHIRGWMSATRKYTGVTILRQIHLGHWIKIDWEKSICCVVIARLYIIVLEVENNVLWWQDYQDYPDVSEELFTSDKGESDLYSGELTEITDNDPDQLATLFAVNTWRNILIVDNPSLLTNDGACGDDCVHDMIHTVLLLESSLCCSVCNVIQLHINISISRNGANQASAVILQLDLHLI